MMTASKSVKVNLGNYESTDLAMSVTGCVEGLETVQEAHLRLHSWLDEAMLGQLVRLYKARGQPADRQMLARRYGLVVQE